jgi:hypothetical protein
VRRNWACDNRTNLSTLLVILEWPKEESAVQSFWNDFDNKLLKVADIMAPLTEFTNNKSCKQIFTQKSLTKLK